MGELINPPSEITLVYREVAPSHVFTALGPRMRGFHISHPDRKTAFKLAEAALGAHVKLAFGVDAAYHISTKYEDFESHINGSRSLDSNKVKARIQERSPVREFALA
jgi:hypothetical protein